MAWPSNNHVKGFQLSWINMVKGVKNSYFSNFSLLGPLWFQTNSFLIVKKLEIQPILSQLPIWIKTLWSQSIFLFSVLVKIMGITLRWLILKHFWKRNPTIWVSSIAIVGTSNFLVSFFKTLSQEGLISNKLQKLELKTWRHTFYVVFLL